MFNLHIQFKEENIMLERTRKLEMLKRVYVGAPSAYVTLLMADKSLEIGKINNDVSGIVGNFVPAMQLVCQNHTIITNMTLKFIDELYSETFSGNATTDVVFDILKKYQNSINILSTMNGVNLELVQKQLEEKRQDGV